MRGGRIGPVSVCHITDDFLSLLHDLIVIVNLGGLFSFCLLAEFLLGLGCERGISLFCPPDLLISVPVVPRKLFIVGNLCILHRARLLIVLLPLVMNGFVPLLLLFVVLDRGLMFCDIWYQAVVARLLVL